MRESTFMHHPQLYTSSTGQAVTVCIAFSEDEKKGSLEKAKEIMIDEAIRLLDSNAVL